MVSRLLRKITVPLVVLAPLAVASAAETKAPRDLGALLAPLAAESKVPGIGGAIITRADGVVALGTAGKRQSTSPEELTRDDLFHLGSCTKAMTATVLARLVARGVLTWTLSPADVFAAPGAVIDPAWKKVTLESLLTHSAGVPSDLSVDGLWARLWRREGTVREQRRVLVDSLLARPPLSAPGEHYLYANAGYAIAGAMAEARLDQAWEEIIARELFTPLGMATAGHGAPGSSERVDQPRGHGADGTPIAPGMRADNPPAIAPAGTVHASLSDWGRFIQAHLAGAAGDESYLPAAAWKHLHTPVATPDGPAYAGGWIVTERPWGDGTVLTHSGSNTMWFAVAWLAPKRGFAVLAVCNQGGDEAAGVCDRVAAALIREFGRPETGSPPATRQE